MRNPWLLRWHIAFSRGRRQDVSAVRKGAKPAKGSLAHQAGPQTIGNTTGRPLVGPWEIATKLLAHAGHEKIRQCKNPSATPPNAATCKFGTHAPDRLRAGLQTTHAQTNAHASKKKHIQRKPNAEGHVHPPTEFTIVTKGVTRTTAYPGANRPPVQ